MTDQKTETTTEAEAKPATTMIEAQNQPPRLPVVDNSSFANLLDTAKFEHMWRVANVFAASGMVPKIYAGKPNGCFVAIQMAIRLEVDPFMFLQNTYISPQGTPAMYGQLAIALVNARGPFTGPIQFELTGEGLERACRAHATHAKTGEICEMTVDVGMAQAEGWYGRNPKWKNIPDLMLMYRSGAWLGRVYAPECLMGMQTTEELEDIKQLVVGDDGVYRPAETPARPARSEFVEQAQPEPEPEQKEEPKPEPEPEPEPEQKAEETKTEPKPKAEPKPKRTTKAKAAPKQEPKPEPEVKQEPEAEAAEGEAETRPAAWAYIDSDGEEREFDDPEIARQSFMQAIGDSELAPALQMWIDNEPFRYRLKNLPGGNGLHVNMRNEFGQIHREMPPS